MIERSSGKGISGRAYRTLDMNLSSKAYKQTSKQNRHDTPFRSWLAEMLYVAFQVDGKSCQRLALQWAEHGNKHAVC